MSRFADRTAIVTGAGSGIGAASADRLAAEGATVILVDTDADGAQATADRIASRYETCEIEVADVAEEGTWSRLAHLVGSKHGGLDLLVSNAGIVRRAPAHELDPDDWDRQLAVNLRPLYLAFRAFHAIWRPMASAVAVSSVHAFIGVAGNPAYSASKAGLLGVVRQLAVEYGPAVRVNAVVPGPIMTAAWDSTGAEWQERRAQETVLGRFGTAEEVAAVIAFLGSTDAAYVTGASVPVDGVWMITKGY